MFGSKEMGGLIKNVFGSQGAGMNFKINLLVYP